MHTVIYRIACTLCCFISWIFLPATAGDLSSDVRKRTSSLDNGDGGYIEIGIAAESYTTPIYGMPEGNTTKGEVHSGITVDFNARYQYQGFFVEAFSQGIEQLTTGYNLYGSDYSSVDWVGMIQHAAISEDDSEDYRGLRKRRFDFMSGPRATMYFGNSIVQAHLLTDISNTHNGNLYSLKIARHWQHRNWTLHGILGAAYRSRDINDYYFSIHASEASEQFPEYHLSSGMAYISEVGATYPLNEKWVFRSFFRRIDVDSEATKSPLIMSNHGEIIATSISYVF